MRKYILKFRKRNIPIVSTVFSIIVLLMLISSTSMSAIIYVKTEDTSSKENIKLNKFRSLNPSNFNNINRLNNIDKKQNKLKNYGAERSEPLGEWMYGYAINNGPQGEGTYRFDIEISGEFEYIGGYTSENYLSGGTYVCERWLAVEYQNGALYEVDIETGELTEIGGGGIGLNGLAIDPTTITLYGCSNNELFVIDPISGEQELVGPFNTDQDHIAIAFDADGTCYSWDVKSSGDSYLYMVNKETGEAIEIGSMGVTLNGPQDGDFFMEQDILFLTAYITSPYNGSYLCSADPETGELEIIDMLDNNCTLAASIFTNIIFCYYDVGVKNILKPKDGDASESIDVAVQVKNFGNSVTDIPINVKIIKENEIEEYNETEYIDLDWDETLTVEMPQWMPEDWQNTSNKNINYTISCYTIVHWDDNLSNNYKNKTFTLHYGDFHDVGCTDIIGPETGPAQIFLVNSTIRNYGQYEECCFKTYVEVAEQDIETEEILIEQDFSESQFPPLGWSITHENWMYSESNYAGGYIGEARLYYQPTDYDIFRLNTPALDTSNYDLIEIDFKHFLNHSGCAYKLEVDTSEDGENWSEVWKVFALDDIGPENISIFTNKNIGSTTYISFALNGSCLYENNWYLDDIVIKGYTNLEPEYEDSICMEQIDPGEEIELDFNEWNPDFLTEEESGKKIYVCNSWTNMYNPQDENPNNDLFSKVIELEYFHDVGIKEIMGKVVLNSAIGEYIPFPDIYNKPGSQNINATIENLGTFSESNLICYAEIYEYITNYSQGTLVYEDNISNINLEDPLGGTQFLEFNSNNFDIEGVYKIKMSLPLEVDDYPQNNQCELIVGVDNTPPIVECEIDPPNPDGDNGWYANPPNITITAYDPDIAPGIPGSGVDFIRYSISGEPWQTIDEESFTFSVNQNGGINIDYLACDKVGNCASIGSILIYIDTVDPNIDEVLWEAEKDGLLGPWIITFTCNAVDATSAMNRVEMYIDDGLWETIESPGPEYTFEYELPNIFDDIIFKFIHYDNAGRSTTDKIEGSNITSYSVIESKKVTNIGIQQKQLLLANNFSGPSYGRPGVNYTFCIEFTDPEGDSIYSIWNWGDGTISDWMGPYGSGETMCASHAWEEDGLYLIKVKFKDEYGNESEWFTHEILIEGKAPHLKINRPKRAIYYKDRWLAPFFFPLIIGDIQIWFGANDNESGLDRIELYIDDELKEIFDIVPKSWLWDETLSYKHEIKLIAYDKAGNMNSKTKNVWKFY